MSRNSTLNIKFTGCNPNGQGNKAAMQPITLELQLETTMRLDDLKEILLDGFKVHRNDHQTIAMSLCSDFRQSHLIHWGRMLLEICPSKIMKM